MIKNIMASAIVMTFCVLNLSALEVSITDNWRYFAGDSVQFSKNGYCDRKWDKVTLPHTWNAADLIDESRGYRRAVSWYRKTLQIPETEKGKKLILRFDGVAIKAEVYLNGELLKTHVGAYTAFTVDITDKYRFGLDNILAVKVDNSSSLAEIVPPVSGDFSFGGGIYRRVFLQTLNPVHFDFEPYASEDLLVQTPNVSESSASVRILGTVKNESMHTYKIRVRHIIYDKNRNKVSEKLDTYKIKPDAALSIKRDLPEVTNPCLWSPENPYLYTLCSVIEDISSGKVLQQTESVFGFRWFSVDNTGFYLNGKKIKLRGAARHQDYAGLGIAIPSEINRNDMEALKDMGANFVRISHYPQDKEIYRACDELGLIAWSEISIVNEVKKNREFAHNCKEMLKEMIYQNYNHPSVVMWGAMNELWDYHPEALSLAHELEQIKKSIDPYRLSCVAFHAFMWEKPYKQDTKEMFQISDVNGVNVYESWYHGDFSTVAPTFDKLRSYSPDRPMFLSEFGAGSDERVHSYSPQCFDFSTEYQLAFNREYINEMEKRDYFIGYSIWNFIDFQVDGRGDSKPNLNQKGMLTSERRKKDIYYYYQARWSSKPMIHISGADWTERMEVCNTEVNTRPVTVYSNQEEVELFHNRKSLGKKKVSAGEVTFDVPFISGKNQLEAVAGIEKDVLDIDMTFVSPIMKENVKLLSEGLYINLGQDHCYFTDPLISKIWIPDQPYRQGGWGYVDGKPFDSWPGNPAHDGVRKGVGANIKDTDLEPLYQTFLLGTTRYRLDVPEGKYEIALHFTEPFNGNERKDSKRCGTDGNGDRVFDVSVNGTVCIPNLNLTQEYGEQRAVSKMIIVDTDNGLEVELVPVKGKPVISGLSIKKLL